MRAITILTVALWTFSARAAEPLTLYIGTYANKQGEGIQRLELDPDTGKLTDKGLACEAIRPSFLALSPDKKHLYAVSEDSGKPAAAAYEVQSDGKLKELNRQP